MKKILALLTFAIIFIATNLSFAQPPPPIPCPPPCTDNGQNWDTPVYHSFDPDPDNCPDCWIGYWVTSKKFYCGQPTVEIKSFQIVKIITSPECVACYSNGEIYRRVLAEAIQNLSFGYPPEDECWYDVHFYSASCWSENAVYNPVTGKYEYHFTPCPNSLCCSLIYKVCNIGTGLTYSVQNPVPPTEYVCSTDPVLCFSVCDWFNIEGSCEFHIPRISLYYGSNAEDFISISPNPADDNIEMTILLQNQDNVRLRIYSILGVLIFDENFYTSKVNKTIKISTAIWNTGMYYYTLEKGNYNFAKGTFVVKH